MNFDVNVFPRRVLVDGTGHVTDEVRNEKKAFEKFVAYWGKRCERTVPKSTLTVVRRSKFTHFNRTDLRLSAKLTPETAQEDASSGKCLHNQHSLGR